MTATSGPMSPRRFARYDPEASCWRTWPAISLWDSMSSPVTWPRWGTSSGGDAYELPTPEHLTIESGSSSLLPTPAVNDMGERKTVQWWDDWTARMKAKHGNGNGHGKSLAIEAMRLLPTPAAADATGSRRYRSGSVSMTGQNEDGNKVTVTLSHAVAEWTGDSTSSPSDVGSTSPAPPHHQLTIEDA